METHKSNLIKSIGNLIRKHVLIFKQFFQPYYYVVYTTTLMILIMFYYVRKMKSKKCQKKVFSFRY